MPRTPKTPAAPTVRATPAKARTAKSTAGKANVTKTTTKANSKTATKQAPAKKATGKGAKSAFLAAQREALVAERVTYTNQAEELKAQADSLALEHEPGDVQFDEEGGEGGTSNVDRELDLVLSAQARAAVEEIDRALAKIDAGTYGTCERCGQPIPEARLEALPHASLCVSCKSGGLSSRR